MPEDMTMQGTTAGAAPGAVRPSAHAGRSRAVGPTSPGRSAARRLHPVSPDREIVAAVRAELSAVEPVRVCDRAAERVGLGSAGKGEAHSAVVARLAVRLGRGTAPEGSPFSPAAFDWDAAAEHCRLAWLRGLFLARGSLSLGFARTHLEFVVDRDDARELARRLASIGLAASVRERRGRGVVTWKSADRVAAFLRALGAGPALLELEARGVARALRGELNRILNAEGANLERAVEAAARQLAAIEQLEAEGRIAAERPTVQAVAHARRERPEATLTELATELALTRSSVQRALERIERLALHPPQTGAPG